MLPNPQTLDLEYEGKPRWREKNKIFQEKFQSRFSDILD